MAEIQLLNYIKKTWGRSMECNHCQLSNSNLSACGQCMSTVYCGTQCQQQDWIKTHQFECINGSGEETDDDDDDKDTIDMEKLTELLQNPEWKKLAYADVWTNILPSYLEGNDLKAMRLVSKQMNINMRRAYLSRFRFIVDEKTMANLTFIAILPYIRSVKMRSITYLDQLPPNVYDVKFTRNSIEDLKAISLSHHITRLTLADNFNGPIEDTHFLHLTHLRIELNFNYPIEELVAPNLTHLWVKSFDHPIEKINLPKLKVLILQGKFNQPIEKLQVPNLTHLALGSRFRQTIENLQVPNLTHLVLGQYFNQPIEKLFVPKLTELIFGQMFNKPIERLHVPLLTVLKISNNFKQSVKGFHAPNLTTVIFPASGEQNRRAFPKEQFPKLVHYISGYYFSGDDFWNK